jgi:transposase InsO family protein
VIGWSVKGCFTIDWNATAPSGSRARMRARSCPFLVRWAAHVHSLLHMRAEVVERRQAVVARLLALRADGRLESQVVRAAAESLGVTERTVWRWLAPGAYDPRWRLGWRTTEEAVEAFYRTGGRPTAAWRLLREEGVPVPSHTAFCRALERDFSLAERAYARHGEDGRRRYPVYRRWEPKARNEVWETDHDELEIRVVPLHGRRLVRPWLTVIEDGCSRLVMGWAVSLYPTSAEVLVTIREGIVIDPERGPWGGVPQLIRFDGGKEFLAHAVKRAAGELGCAALTTAPYSPHLKGKVERPHRTIGEGLIAMLPHYTGARWTRTASTSRRRSSSRRRSRSSGAARRSRSATCRTTCARSRCSPRTAGLCTAYPQDELTREQSDAVIQARHEAAREMGRRKASAQQDAEKGELLKILGLADQLNKPIPPAGQEQAEA